MISEKKMQIVIDNYFKSECDVNTSIRQAFEKGFRIGVKKGLSAQLERKKGGWIFTTNFPDGKSCYVCKDCGAKLDSIHTNFCGECGADMREGDVK